jgi:hypothetical protein
LLKIASRQRCLFRTRPLFDAFLPADRVVYIPELRSVNQGYRAARECVTPYNFACIMLREALINVARYADVIAAVVASSARPSTSSG